MDSNKPKIKLILRNHSKYLSSNGITLRDYLDKNPFPSKSFELRGSEEFFDYVKFNNYDMVNQILNKNINIYIKLIILDKPHFIGLQN